MLVKLLSSYSTLEKDRFLAPDIAAVARLLQEGKVSATPTAGHMTLTCCSQVLNAVQSYIATYEDSLIMTSAPC